MNYSLAHQCSLPNTIQLVSDCWSAAEAKTQEAVGKQFGKAPEEFLTLFFSGHLNYELRSASDDDRLKAAFEEDLTATWPALSSARFHLERLSNDLFMDCKLHNRKQEAKSGGDFGLTLIRPDLGVPYHGIEMKHQGLLCQAKLRAANGKWRKLTARQRIVLPDNLAFTQLLPYSYSDAKRTLLNPFSWQDCNGASLDQLQEWLAKGTFPRTISSEEMLCSLATGLIGTSDQGIIEKRIALSSRPQVIIRIDWPDDQGPPPAHEWIHAIRSIEPAQRILEYAR